MKWFRRMAERYEAWRQRTEEDMVREVLMMEIDIRMKIAGVMVVRDERPEL